MRSRTLYPLSCWAVIAFCLLWTRHLDAAELKAPTISAWDTYVRATEARIAAELSSGKGFLVLDSKQSSESEFDRKVLQTGQILVEKMRSHQSNGLVLDVPGGMIHHWRGAIFVPQVSLDEVFVRVANPRIEDTRQEDVLDSSVLTRSPDSLRLYLKLQRSKIITIVYNTEHEVRFQRQDRVRAWSSSTAVRIAEIMNPNSPQEKERPEGRDRGFLWRLNSYWRYEQVPGGVIVECESISLSRSIPSLLEYLIRPLIDKVARESMERTLGSMRGRLTANKKKEGSVIAVVGQYFFPESHIVSNFVNDCDFDFTDEIGAIWKIRLKRLLIYKNNIGDISPIVIMPLRQSAANEQAIHNILRIA